MQYFPEIQINTEIDDLYRLKIPVKTIQNCAFSLNERWSIDKLFKYCDRLKYCLINKIPQMYDAELYMLKTGANKECAENHIKNLKLSKATSLEGFCKRHGIENGILMFEKFRKTSRKSSLNIVDKFKTQYRDSWKIEYSSFMKRKSKWCKEYYLSREECDEEEAQTKATEFYLKKCGIRKQYYLDLGISINDVGAILEKIYKKRVFNNLRSISNLKRIFGKEWHIKHSEINASLRNTMESKGIWITLEDISDWKKYGMEVDYWTNIAVKSYPDMEKDRNRLYHIDHKFSKKQGFIDDIPSKIIGSIINLELLPASENCSKKCKCSISREELLEKYSNHENNQNN
jgi:hypothetical protein